MVAQCAVSALYMQDVPRHCHCPENLHDHQTHIDSLPDVPKNRLIRDCSSKHIEINDSRIIPYQQTPSYPLKTPYTNYWRP